MNREGASSRAVLLVSHGTVERLEDLAAFVTNVRRGRAPQAELVAEVRRRYEAIGGGSPLNRTSAALAQKLNARLGVRVAWANRLWSPYVREVLAELAGAGVRRVGVVPLAPFSAHVYAADASAAAAGHKVEVSCAPAWGGHAKLVAAFAARVEAAVAQVRDLARASLLLTAHSLPQSVIDAGDPYERDVRAAAEAVATEASQRVGKSLRWTLAFQSQGLGGPGLKWLGPDLATALDEAAARGEEAVVVAAIGFLADHVETLYDLDIEAAARARDRGLTLVRARSLDDSDDLVDLLADLARPLLGHA
jgi:ferrochelatase